MIKVLVTPRASTESIKKIDDSTYRIRVKEPAEDNKANRRILTLLAQTLGVPRASIKIKNPLSRKKLVEIGSSTHE